MTPFRRAIFDILTAHQPALAFAWAHDYRPSHPRMSVSNELPEVSNYFFRLLGRIQGVPCDVQQCVTANHNSDHWLRDFANVVAPVIVRNSHVLVTPPAHVDLSVSELGLLLDCYD